MKNYFFSFLVTTIFVVDYTPLTAHFIHLAKKQALHAQLHKQIHAMPLEKLYQLVTDLINKSDMNQAAEIIKIGRPLSPEIATILKEKVETVSFKIDALIQQQKYGLADDATDAQINSLQEQLHLLMDTFNNARRHSHPEISINTKLGATAETPGC